MSIITPEKNFLRQLKNRKKVISKNKVKEPNYFDIRDYYDFANYSTYIIVKPRSIGGTYSCMMTVAQAYTSTGEYSVGMRTSHEEVKAIIEDYKTNRPEAGEPHGKIRGKTLIDEETGKAVIKFVSLSTVHNLASITGDGCFGLFYDEFLPRTTRRLPRAFYKITDFIKTIERKHLLTVTLIANATTLNSDILHKFELGNDLKEVDNKEKRLRYRYITEWKNPPIVENISTASLGAAQSQDLSEFFDKAKFIDGDGGLVIPEIRVGSLRHITQYLLEDVNFTLSLTDDNMGCVVEGHRLEKDDPVMVLTTVDGFQKGNYKRPYDLIDEMERIVYALDNDNIIFTSFEVKDTVFKFLQRIFGKVQKGEQ